MNMVNNVALRNKTGSQYRHTYQYACMYQSIEWFNTVTIQYSHLYCQNFMRNMNDQRTIQDHAFCIPRSSKLNGHMKTTSEVLVGERGNCWSLFTPRPLPTQTDPHDT